APQARALDDEAGAERGAPRRTHGVREQHRNYWGVKGSAYLFTESRPAGASWGPALPALGGGEPLRPGHLLVALLALGLTGVLLVADLRQPARVLWTLTRPQWRSWLVRGACVIT